MNNLYSDLAVKLTENLGKEIDVFIVQRIVSLFDEGVLELSSEIPSFMKEEFPYTSLEKDKVTFRVDQNWILRYKGDEEIAKLKAEIEILRQYGNKDCTHMADEVLHERGLL